MGIAKVNRNYQVTIPKDIRKIEGIEIGDTILFAIEDEKIHFLKMEKNEVIKKAAGAWKNKIKGSSVDYVKGLRKDWEVRAKRLGI
ncbi:AbrB/MazE/SpoVT family DNA-binding domain-containing protein [Candidatus Woesearchaeota archaeon]|nr:AbrB/MazE/SpoVT family DNA-binding domain-containing protein [Candidatus Woesearchaeota archaeon]